MTKERRTFSSEFKLQMVRLYKNGKLKNEIIREYDLKPSIFSNSIKQHQNTGSFNHQDNLKSDEKELIKLRKEVQHLKMEHVSACLLYTSDAADDLTRTKRSDRGFLMHPLSRIKNIISHRQYT